MSAPHATAIIEGYLARLDLGLLGSDPLRRRELVEDVRAHIAEARAGLADETDADVFAICDRLGEPADLVREVGSATAVAQPASAPYVWSWLEIAAIALTVMAWPVGAILTLLSRVWTRREKVIATAIGAVTFAMGFPLSAPFIGPVLGTLVPSFGGAAPIFVGTLGALPLVAAAYLAYRLTRATAPMAQIA
ncbi:MAG TPA: hypothetical protein VGR46_15465 [Candidatus Limnocylindria bacterium]|jgi:uncharacterized membrane protein|nr:hypothetical protein [Candidatus Limnocylindria bacterium]